MRDLPVILWALIAVAGAGTHIGAVFDAIHDLAEVRAAQLGEARELWTRLHLRNEAIRLYGQALSGMVAWHALTLDGGFLRRGYIIAGFILLAILLLFSSLRDRRARHRLLNIGLRSEAELDAPAPHPAVGTLRRAADT